ncbi:MAG: hypothetical protein O2818_03670 [Bacteroidetes bacterium]|nr:hypothetical protein [Bacteroidota bacterium]MDA1335966.1 hypothetical protein [Bacteroidota bacterium]
MRITLSSSFELNKAVISGFFCVFLIALGFQNSGCNRVNFSDDPTLELTFSADTVLFDTVFTTIGSVTLPLKVYNPHANAILIDEIALEGGVDSPFRVNVDGAVGPTVEDWPLLGRDSLWIFVEVTVDPTSAATPFIVEDAIRINANGINQEVRLIAWGQNAHFHGGLEQITPLASCDETWQNDLPHVIYGIVEIEPGCRLTIEPGTQVHVHKGGGLLVYQSTLDVQGTLNNEVVFQGDRLEENYSDEAGQWGIELDFQFETDYGIEEVTAQRGGIWLYGGVNCSMNYAILKNGTIGLQVDTTGSTLPALTLTNTIIHNMSAYGLYAQGATIDGYNDLIYDCGQSTAAFTLGGAYRLDHCTFANYWSEGVRQSPSVLFTDWYEDIDGNIQIRSLEGSEFNNCIFWGNNYSLTDFDELVVSLLNIPVNPIVRNSALDVDDPDFPLQLIEACTTSNEPPFASTSDRDFHLTSNNTLWDGGSSQFNVALDLDGLPRNIGIPDKGCFERQQ